jgi:hypothetical protein
MVTHITSQATIKRRAGVTPVSLATQRVDDFTYDQIIEALNGFAPDEVIVVSDLPYMNVTERELLERFDEFEVPVVIKSNPPIHTTGESAVPVLSPCMGRSAELLNFLTAAIESEWMLDVPVGVAIDVDGRIFDNEFSQAEHRTKKPAAFSNQPSVSSKAVRTAHTGHSPIVIPVLIATVIAVGLIAAYTGRLQIPRLHAKSKRLHRRPFI